MGAADVERALAGIVAELADMAPAEAAAHAHGAGALSLLRQCAPSARDDYGRALVERAPALAADVERVCSPSVAESPSPRWQPFPVGALGFTVGRFVTQVAAAIGCDDSMVALPALACLAGVIGNRRVIELKRGYSEPAIVWAAVVARSGARKTPAMSEVLRPLRRAEADAIALESRRRTEYEDEFLRWKDTPSRHRGARPLEPESGPRLLVSDITIEALALRLSESPGGLLVGRDELAGWIRSFDAYRAGRGGDVQAWLSMHNAASLTVDRRTGDTLSVRRAAVSIVGTVQPEVLAASLRGEHVSNGLAARLLYTMPPATPAYWTDAEISGEVRDGWARLLGRLRGLPVPDEPQPLRVTSDASSMYRRWFNERQDRHAAADTDAAAASGAKIDACAARLALIVALANDADAGVVDADAMASGLELADWFGQEGERVYAAFNERPEHRERRTLTTWIEGKGGAITERELARGPRKYRAPGAATVALEELVGVGIGRWAETPAGPDGGRPSRRFVLRDDDELRGGDGGDGDKTPKHDGGDKTRMSPSVAGVAGGDETPNTEGGFVTVAASPDEKSGDDGADDDGRLDADEDQPAPWSGFNL